MGIALTEVDLIAALTLTIKEHALIGGVSFPVLISGLMALAFSKRR